MMSLELAIGVAIGSAIGSVVGSWMARRLCDWLDRRGW